MDVRTESGSVACWDVLLEDAEEFRCAAAGWLEPHGQGLTAASR